MQRVDGAIFFGISRKGGGRGGYRQSVLVSGRSQAVRLPKEYRFDCDEVRIRRIGNAVVLERIVNDWTWLDAAVRELSPDYLVEGRQQPEAQQRPELEELFPE